MIELKDSLEEDYGSALIDIEEWKVFNDSRNLLKQSEKPRFENRFRHMIKWMPYRLRLWTLKNIRPNPQGNLMEKFILNSICTILWRYMDITGKLYKPKTDVDELTKWVDHMIELNPDVKK